MADIVEITDFSAPELDVYARLTGAQLRACPQGGLFIVASAKKKTTSGAGEREKLKIQEAPPLL